jgi:peptidoglycan/xylan/chitin deacetylase (PgdA/CDA1 family)
VILCLLFHRIGGSAYSNDPVLFRKTAEFIRGRYRVVVPGDAVTGSTLNVCLSFDDAYYDFYHHVFPVLRELNMRALLAVPVKYILDTSSVAPEARLGVTHDEAMRDEVYREQAPFCTWDEIGEMVESGLVVPASHSFSHCAITEAADLQLEIVRSKEVLMQKLGRDVTSFVYPYGRCDRAVHEAVMRHYAFALRIGNAFNLNWRNLNGLLYRINADNLNAPDEPFRKIRMTRYFLKLLSNMARGK